MLLNTFEHGYSDALKGRQRILGSEDYQEGYRIAIRQRVADRWLSLAAATMVMVGLGAALAVSIAKLAQDVAV